MITLFKQDTPSLSPYPRGNVTFAIGTRWNGHASGRKRQVRRRTLGLVLDCDRVEEMCSCQSVESYGLVPPFLPASDLNRTAFICRHTNQDAIRWVGSGSSAVRRSLWKVLPFPSSLRGYLAPVLFMNRRCHRHKTNTELNIPEAFARATRQLTAFTYPNPA